MSLSATLLHSASVLAATVPIGQVVRTLFNLSALAGLVVFFRPLLTGILRAAVLVVRPRHTREELAARNKQRSAQSLRRHINAATSHGEAAELRALAARG